MIQRINRAFFIQVFIVHVSLTALTALVMYLLGAAPNWKDFALGSLIGGGNLILMVWALQHALLKKSFALTVASSVFKYGFLILIFWFAARFGKKVGYEFIVGILLMLPTTAYVAFELLQFEKEKIENKN